jgi:hypothetical protein
MFGPCAVESGVVNSQWWRFVAEVSPGLVLSLVGVVAALAAYALLRQSTRGRAREAIAYLSGLVAGLVLTLVLAAVFRPLARAGAIAEAGLFASFFGPFAGMARAKWERPRRRARRSAGRNLARPTWDGLQRAGSGR